MEVLLVHPDGALGRAVDIEAPLADDGGVRSPQRPAGNAVEIAERLVADVQPRGLFEVEGLGVDVGILGEDALLVAGDQNRREEALLIVVQRLPAAEVVDARPAHHGPAVVELPDHRAHAPAAVAPPVLHAVLDGLGLQQLGGVDKGVEGVGVEVGLA